MRPAARLALPMRAVGLFTSSVCALKTFEIRVSIEHRARKMREARRPATYARHHAGPTQKTDADGTRHWITRRPFRGRDWQGTGS